MTKEEFKAWKQVTEASRYHWTVDRVQLHNHNRYLIYKGGEQGQFVSVDADGTASIGTYEGAVPCITDACFKTLHSRKFETQNEAIHNLIERAGLNFLLDIMGF